MKSKWESSKSPKNKVPTWVITSLLFSSHFFFSHSPPRFKPLGQRFMYVCKLMHSHTLQVATCRAALPAAGTWLVHDFSQFMTVDIEFERSTAPHQYQ